MIGLEDGVAGADSFEVVLVKAPARRVRASSAARGASIDGRSVVDSAAPEWSFIETAALNPPPADDLASKLSGELAACAISVGYQDTAEWTCLAVFKDGCKVQEYSFGQMDGPAPGEAAERGLFSEEDYLLVLANGIGAEVSDEELLSEHALVDSLLRQHGAFLGWEALECPGS